MTASSVAGEMSRGETLTSSSVPGIWSWRIQTDMEKLVGSENGDTVSEIECSKVNRCADCRSRSADSGTWWNCVSPSGSTLCSKDSGHQSMRETTQLPLETTSRTLMNTCEPSRTHSTTAWMRYVNGQFAVTSSGSLGGWRRPSSKKILALASDNSMLVVPVLFLTRLNHERGQAVRATRTNSRVISSEVGDPQRASKLNQVPTDDHEGGQEGG